MFAHDRYITITVAYEAELMSHPSLGWIAPELKDAGLRLIEERGAPQPLRTWAGLVDESTYEQFAEAWQVPDEPSGERPRAPHIHTFDGLNWQTNGESPIVYVTLRVHSPHRERSRMAAGEPSKR
jgi:hypothetical protein